MSNQKITCQNGNLQVPNNPIIPFIEGDGTGADIWNASVKVFDAAVEKAYGGTRKIEWREVLAGEKAFNKTQRSFDYTCWWWNSVFECGITTTIGSLCLCSSSEMVYRSSFSCKRTKQS